ncbi:MAG: hypothetical protein FJX56_10835 [Alphaproteobacteria bacterium]|nr:hypothetical protein [Alphaproteobacteria bacterium]
MHQSILVYRRYLYLKCSVAVALVALVAYAAYRPAGPANGNTWLGYTLGVISAALILWLMWFGVRKRIYGPGHVRLEDWLSAHVYLGLALIVTASLHTGFEFGWNVHTLAYVLMLLVIVSGVYGVLAYIRYPRQMTENRRQATLTALMAEIAEVDRECRQVSMGIGDAINSEVHKSSQNTRIGGSMWRQLAGDDPQCATRAAYERVRTLARAVPEDQSEAARQLVSLLGKKLEFVRRARRDVQYKALMEVWLYFHVPLAVALLAALVSHVVAVFYYW